MERSLQLVALCVCVGLVFISATILIWWEPLMRLVEQRHLRKMFYLIPRRMIREIAKKGELLQFAESFLFTIAMGCEFPCVVVTAKDGRRFNSFEALSMACIDFFCVKQEYKRYVKKFPAYKHIELLDFTEVKRNFEGCIGKYEQF